jgi:hypothetical protein
MTNSDNLPSKAIVWELFILSAVSLFFELLVIRWMSADVRAFTVFKTFPLATCFVGLGLGFALSRDNPFRLTLWAILQFVATMTYAQISLIAVCGFPSASVFQWQNLVVNGSPGNAWTQFTGSSVPEIVFLLGFMLAMILLLAGPFAACVCIGSRLATLFNQLKPLTAYSVNIAGAITGSVLFSAASFLGWSPSLLLLPPVGILIFYLVKRFGWRRHFLVATALIPLFICLAPKQTSLSLRPSFDRYRDSSAVFWSPYQRVDLTTFKFDGPNSFSGLELGANRAFYQYYFCPPAQEPAQENDRSQSESPNTKMYRYLTKERDLPYDVSGALDNVLIAGAGTGLDVSFAIKHGAKSVDAVEIDPVILKIGQKFNKDYSSNKVNLVCDDARHFFNCTHTKYDLILFAFLDSQTVTGQGSSVRVDTYIYTKESIQRALSLLKPNGVLCLGFCSVAPWVKSRLFDTLKEAAGYAPILAQEKDKSGWMLLGSPVLEHRLVLPVNYQGGSPPDISNVRCLSDDWPYLYVDISVIDIPYLLIVLEMLLLAVFAGRRLLFGKSDPSYWSMFFLGAAFMLLEFHAISFLSLLYGSTWVTAAIVINGILILLLLANLVVITFRALVIRHLPFAYLALALALAASYCLNPHAQLVDAQYPLLAYAVVTLLTLLPLGAAGVIFAGSFSQFTNPARALAFNLFGAVVGAFLEYLSNYFGIRALVVLSGLLYFLAFVCVLWVRRQEPATSTADGLRAEGQS